MADPITYLAGVAPLRTTEFRNREEFELYLRESDALRGNRWLYEQSLATTQDAVVLDGTCGLCLCSASFTAPTRGGETVASGRVPNWREGLVCDCEQRLVNRERALVHYLMDTSSLQPWMRVLGSGLLGTLRPVLSQLSDDFAYWSESLDDLAAAGAPLGGQGYHLIVSVEQFDVQSARPRILSALASLLVPGGQLIFTAPCDVNADRPATGPIGLSVLKDLREHGFADAKICTYWSEEFGYLGAFNFIFAATKGLVP
jgi:hypothetical protein